MQFDLIRHAGHTKHKKTHIDVGKNMHFEPLIFQEDAREYVSIVVSGHTCYKCHISQGAEGDGTKITYDKVKGTLCFCQ